MSDPTKKNLKIWMNGGFINWEDAQVHVMTHTLHYGLGVFEGIRCYETPEGPKVFRLKEHVKRLFDSARILGLSVELSEENVSNIIRETIKINKLQSCYIRPLFYLDDSTLGLNCTKNKVLFMNAAWEWGAYLGKEGIENGIRTKVVSYTRHHPNIFPTKAKVCGAYVNSILGKLEALKNGYEEAIMLDPFGNVAEGSGENIFIVRNGVLYTPPATSVLEGITRATIMTLAKDLEIEVREQHFARDTLLIADEAFFTGTAAEVTPIREVDGVSIGGRNGAGEITKIIQEKYFSLIRGGNERHQEWLEAV